MNPVDQGRFCQKCTKTVLDVTHWSDAQILETHYNSFNGICVRIPTDRVVNTTQHSNTSRSWRYLFMALLATLVLTVKRSFSIAQTGSTSFNQKQNPANSTVKNYVIRGTVMDSTLQKQPIPFAAVTILQNGDVIGGVLTDSNGLFQFDSLGYGGISENFTIVVDCIGYASLTQTITSAMNGPIEVFMQESRIELKTTILNLVPPEDTLAKPGVSSPFRGHIMGSISSPGFRRPLLQPIIIKPDIDIIIDDMVEPNKMRLPDDYWRF